jgi:hypothetical protein
MKADSRPATTKQESESPRSEALALHANGSGEDDSFA